MKKKKIINVVKFGVLPNTGELLTDKVQALIDSLPSAGGEIYFPRGKYLLSTLYLKSNVTINIARGAFLLGTTDISKYGEIEKWDFPLYQDLSHSNFNCSLFVGKKLKNITFKGFGVIDMMDGYDVDNVKNNDTHRGAKVITLVECKNVLLEDIKVKNATDLALYFVECDHLIARRLDLDVHIDGISPDNCTNVLVEDCKIVSGDDALVFKSTYNLNHLSECNNLIARNCYIKTRCNAIKFGTESNGGFRNAYISNMYFKNVREAGIAIESVDGAIIDNLNFDNIRMVNVNAPIFIILGKRMRGPKELSVGSVSNIKISNVHASGPYPERYKTSIWNYYSFVNHMNYQDRWNFWGSFPKDTSDVDKTQPWQTTSNICGLSDKPISNITLSNITLELFGGAKKGQYKEEVFDDFDGYPEVFSYGWILPASGLFIRHVENLVLDNVSISTYKKDSRDKIITIDCK